MSFTKLYNFVHYTDFNLKWKIIKSFLLLSIWTAEHIFASREKEGPFIYVLGTDTQCICSRNKFSVHICVQITRSMNCSRYHSVQICNRHDSRAAQFDFNALHCATWKQSSRNDSTGWPWVITRGRRSCVLSPAR